MGSNILVGAAKLRAVATQLDHLCEDAKSTMASYLGHSHDSNAPGIWMGMAAQANVSTAQDIHDVQMKLNTQWGELIQALRAAADTFEDREEQSRAAIASIPNQA